MAGISGVDDRGLYSFGGVVGFSTQESFREFKF